MIMHMMERGIEQGKELTREIIAMGVPNYSTKYAISKNLGVSRQQVYKWINNINAPSEASYKKLLDYRDMLQRFVSLNNDFQSLKKMRG